MLIYKVTGKIYGEFQVDWFSDKRKAENFRRGEYCEEGGIEEIKPPKGKRNLIGWLNQYALNLNG